MIQPIRYCKSLSQLLAGIVRISESNECWINDICLDSRDVTEGALFVAIPGHHSDGRDYIAQAWKKGAIAIVQEGDEVSVNLSLDGLVVTLPNVRQHLSVLTNRFWDFPSQDLTLVGITGTNGKTSISHYCAQLVESLGHKAAVIGTLGYGQTGALQNTINTTPDNITLQRRMAEFRDSGIQYVFMEVSSHSLDQQRVDGLAFDFAVFSNLSRDHLDYHGDMQHYAKSKSKLFEFASLKALIVNADDPFGQSLIERYHPIMAVYSSTIEDEVDLGQTHSLIAHDVAFSSSGLTCNVSFDAQVYPIACHLFGRFNLSNVLNAAAVALALGFNPASVFAKCGSLNAVSGRMQLLAADGKPNVIIDYAHTPDALQKVLQSIELHCTGRIFCVFGCGGDRDAGKRPLMGEIAERYADQIILTNDNPRTESAENIIQNIKAGIQHLNEIVVEFDRAKAISLAIDMASVEDVVLIAGKGHENYQIIGSETIQFSDIEYVKQALCLKHNGAC